MSRRSNWPAARSGASSGSPKGWRRRARSRPSTGANPNTPGRPAQGPRARRRQAATAALRLHATLLQGALDLEDHGTPKGFTAWHLRDGALPVYQLAFLLADDLIERRGFDRTRVYFASFRRSAERRANFAAAFGQGLEEFAADALARLKKASAL